MIRLNTTFVIFVITLGLAPLAGGPLAFARSSEDTHSAKSDSGERDNLGRRPGDDGYVPPNSSNMPMLLVPVVIDGERSHYIFVSYRLVMHNELQVDRVNQKMAWLHDAFMRDVFKSNPVDPNNPHRLDVDLVNRRFREIAKGIMHDDLIKSVYLTNVLSEKEPVPDHRRVPTRLRKAKTSSGH